MMLRGYGRSGGGGLANGEQTIVAMAREWQAS